MWFIHVVHTGLQHDRAEVVESLRSLSQQDIFRSLEACPWKGLMWISWDFSWFPFTVWLLVQCHHFLSYTPVIWCHLPELGDPMPYSGLCGYMHSSREPLLYSPEPLCSLLGDFYDPIHLFAVSLRFALKFPFEGCLHGSRLVTAPRIYVYSPL